MSLMTGSGNTMTLQALLRRPAAVIAFIAVTLPAFWFGLKSLGTVWATPEYSHGPLIPLISAYLYLHEMRKIPPAAIQPGDQMPGVWVIVASLVIALFGNLAQIADIVTYGLILWVMGIVLLTNGWQRGKHMWAGVVHLVFMLPLPAMIYWKLSIFLQLTSSEIGVAVIRAMNIPVFLDGNVIDLGLYQLQVAEACSGLRYLFPIMSFSYIFALLYRGPRWHKAVLLLSAAPITVLMNSFRIGMIGVLVNYYGIEQAEGFLHIFEGWVIFVSCIGALILLSTLLRKVTPAGIRGESGLELDFENSLPQLRRVMNLRGSVPVAVAFTVTMAATVITMSLPAIMQSKTVDRLPFALFPVEIDEWKGSKTFLTPDVDRVLAADDYLAMVFHSSEHKAPIDFFVAYYDELTSNSGGIHSPEVCIPSAGWEMSRITKKTVAVTADGSQVLTVNRAIIERGLDRQLVYYYFDQRGRRLTNDYVAKMLAIWDSIVKGRSDGALVRLVTPIAANEKPEAAEQRLNGFLKRGFEILPEYVPE